MNSVLADVTTADVRIDPYPHLYLRDVLPEALCQRLIAELPPLETVLKGKAIRENARADFMLSDARMLGGVSDTWRAFMEANASQAFLDDVLRVFAPFIRERYPQFTKGEGLARLKSGVRNIDNYDNCDILLDADIGMNTPFLSRMPSSVRTAHVDHPRKLFAGLLYLRRPEDDSTGGSFVVCRWKKGVRPRFAGQHIYTQQVEEVEEVPYRSNTLVLFLNGFDAVHSVTPRQPTPHTRWFLNVFGEVQQPLFDLDAYQEDGMRKFARKLLKRINVSLDGVEVRK